MLSELLASMLDSYRVDMNAHLAIDSLISLLIVYRLNIAATVQSSLFLFLSNRFPRCTIIETSFGEKIIILSSLRIILIIDACVALKERFLRFA